MARSTEFQVLDDGDRRSEQRKLSVMRAALIEIGDETRFCRIVNVSHRGLEVRQYRSSEPGTRVRIRFASDSCISGTIVWSRGHSAGILLDQALDLTTLVGSRSADPKGRRSLPRATISADGMLTVESIAYPVTVFDISPAGARTRSLKEIAGRGPASLRLAGLPAIDCRICWTDGNDAGLRFNAPIEMRLLEEWIRILQMAPARRVAG